MVGVVGREHRERLFARDRDAGEHRFTARFRVKGRQLHRVQHARLPKSNTRSERLGEGADGSGPKSGLAGERPPGVRWCRETRRGGVMRGWLLAAVSALALIAGACGSGDEGGDAVTTSGPATTAPSLDEAPSVTTGDVVEDEDGREITFGFIGDELRDGSLTFRVDRVQTDVRSLPAEYLDPVTPPEGARMVVVTVTVRNDGQTSVTPFCGGTGVVLIDHDRRNFDLVDDAFGIDGNEICSDLQPGFKTTARLPFFVPADARFRSVALWDPDEDGFEPLGDYIEVGRQP